MTVIFLLQLLLPLFFIAWIALAPLNSKLAFLCQIFGTSAGLLSLALTGLWLFPPWWTPYAFAALLLAAMLAGWRRRRPFRSRLPSSLIAWIVTAVFIAMGGWGVYQSALALAGRVSQAGGTVDLTFPLKGGTYLVVNGGSNLNVNTHLMTLDANIARFQAYRGQSYGVDIVKLDAWGLRANGLQPSEPDAYIIYGTPVYAPCSGVVLIALDGLPDMPVPQVDRAHMAGNHVLLRCKDADVLLGHFMPGSVVIAKGSQVAAGDQIGRVGNSGNTGEPHLHIHAQERGTAAEPMSGNPLPMSFGGRFLVRNDRVQVP
jgi:MYXO-CTERM domain-containing protein